MTMNLSGSLDAFRLDEVLSLLGMGGRTARLQVSTPTGVGVVHLTDGQVSSATADRARAGLLRQLVTTAAVPASDLASALETEQPVRALVGSGVVDADVARGVAAEHAVDALGEMLAWTEGEFAVWVGENDPADIGVRYPVHELVDRGRERLAQWEHLRAELPAGASVLTVVAEQAEAPHLAVDEWAVLARVDGRRTLAEVVAAAGCAPLVASDRLVGLIGRGLVRVQDPQAEAQPDEVGRMLDAFEGHVPVGESADVIADSVPSVDEASLLLGLVKDEPVVIDEPAEFARGAIDEPAELAQAARLGAPAVVEEPVGFDLPLEERIGQEQVLEPIEIEAALADSIEVVEQVAVAEPVGSVEPVAVAEPIAVAEPLGSLEPVAIAVPVEFVESVENAAQIGTVESIEFVEHVADVESVPSLAPAEQVDSAQAEAPEESAPAEPLVVAEPVGIGVDQASDLVETAGVPVAPIAPAVEWSPWAQALGLAAPAPAGELIVDPLAGRGIAQLIADAAGLPEVEHVPVPLAPLSLDAGEWSADDEDLEQRARVVHDLEVPVPGPRAPGDAEVAQAPAQPEIAQVEAPPVDVPEVNIVPAESDPLAGGLLAQLISGVRGL